MIWKVYPPPPLPSNEERTHLRLAEGLFTRYQNEFHSGMSFVPEWSSYCTHMTKSTSSAILKRPFCPPFWKRYVCTTRPRLHGLRFYLGTEFVFRLHDTRMKYHTRTRISIGLKTGMDSFRNDLCGDEISSRYHVNRYREIYGDGITLSGMKVIPVSCKRPLRRWDLCAQSKLLLANSTGLCTLVPEVFLYSSNYLGHLPFSCLLE